MNGFRNLDSNYRRRDYVPGQNQNQTGLGAMRQWANVPPGGQGNAVTQQMTDLQYRMLKAREQNVVARQRLATQIIQGDHEQQQHPYRSPVKGGDGFSKYRQSNYEPESVKPTILSSEPIEQRYSRFSKNDPEENKTSSVIPTNQKSPENDQTSNNNENQVNPQPPAKQLSLAEENANRQRSELEELAKLTRPPRCERIHIIVHDSFVQCR